MKTLFMVVIGVLALAFGIATIWGVIRTIGLALSLHPFRAVYRGVASVVFGFLFLFFYTGFRSVLDDRE